MEPGSSAPSSPAVATPPGISPTRMDLVTATPTKMVSAADSCVPILTVDEALAEAKFGKYQQRLMFVTGLCSAGDAMEVLLLSFLLLEIGKEWPLPKYADGMLSALVFFGVFVGNILSGLVGDQFGRWYGFVSSSAIVAVFGMISAFATNVVWLGLWRFIVGIGLGGGHTAFTLFTEFLPVHNRGRLLLINQVFWSFGAVVEVMLAWFILPRYGWRPLLFLSTWPMLLVLSGAMSCPESPMFLASQHRMQEATDLLNAVSKMNGSQLHCHPWTLVGPSLVGRSRGHLGNVKTLMAQFGPTTRRLWVLWFASSFTYYGIVLIAPRFFPNSGQYQDVLIGTFAEFPGMLIPFFAIDIFGRKITLTTLFGVCAMACSAMAIRMSEWLGVIVLFVARGTISAAFISLYVVTAESYPTSLRSTGFGVAASISRVAGMITSFVSEDEPIVLAASSFAICAGFAAAASITLPVETANHSLASNDDKDKQLFTLDDDESWSTSEMYEKVSRRSVDSFEKNSRSSLPDRTAILK